MIDVVYYRKLDGTKIALAFQDSIKKYMVAGGLTLTDVAKRSEDFSKQCREIIISTKTGRILKDNEVLLSYFKNIVFTTTFIIDLTHEDGLSYLIGELKNSHKIENINAY